MKDKSFIYVLVIIAGITLLNLYTPIKRKNNLEETLVKKEIITEDVGWKRGKGYEEKFTEVYDEKTGQTQRFYSQIDGKPIEECPYFNEY